MKSQMSHHRQGTAGWGQRVWLLWWQWKWRSPGRLGQARGGPEEGDLVLEYERLMGGEMHQQTEKQRWRLWEWKEKLMHDPLNLKTHEWLYLPAGEDWEFGVRRFLLLWSLWDFGEVLEATEGEKQAVRMDTLAQKHTHMEEQCPTYKQIWRL